MKEKREGKVQYYNIANNIDLIFRIMTQEFTDYDDLSTFMSTPQDFCNNWSVVMYFRGISLQDTALVRIKLTKNIFAANKELSFKTFVEKYVSSEARLTLLKAPDLIPFKRVVVFVIDHNVVKDLNQTLTNFEDIIIDNNLGKIDVNQKMIYKKLPESYFMPGSFCCSFTKYTKFEQDVIYQSLYIKEND